MGKFKIILFAVIGMLLMSCVQTRMPKYENSAQNNLDSIVSYYSENHYGINEVKLEELFDKYHNELKDLFRSNYISDWQAMIQSIKIDDTNVHGIPHKRISFKLINGLDVKPKITFDAAYYVNTDSIGNDSIYNKIKEIGNLEKVLFTGDILFKNNGSVLTIYNSLGKDYLFTYPTFNLIITDISKEKPKH